MQGLIYAGMVAALAYWVFGAGRAVSGWRSAVKTAALGVPLVALWLWGWPLLFCLGLLFCVWGDFLLSRDGGVFLRAGIGAFAVGHMLYIFAMIAVGFQATTEAGVGILALVLLGLSTRIWLLPHTGALSGQVAGYVWVILIMGASAMLCFPANPWLRAGALLFILSDLVLATEMFVLRDGRAKRLAPFVVWPLYVAGQAGLILGFAP